MPKGDKYLNFTNYLRYQHAIGQDHLTLSFHEIDEINKSPFPPSTRRYSWGNTAGHSYSISWLKSGYLAKSDLEKKLVHFTYSPVEAGKLLNK
jgi:hypothetical protein